MVSRVAHRPDIDGLRALAVLPVILFHARFRYAPGGFLGVDIFFVISGYLITAHIVGELKDGRFSLGAFYERRIRRIAPALCFMLCCVSCVSYFLLFPSEMLEFERALVAAVLSVSNIYFWKATGYFSDHSNPLLHTWSLAVEEQFYVFIPLLLMLLFRNRRRGLSPTLAGLTIASVLLCWLTYRQYPEATFFLLPRRPFELLIGSLFGVGIVRCPRGRVWREVISAAGLAMALVLILRLPPTWRFPGPGVLGPLLGGRNGSRWWQQRTNLYQRSSFCQTAYKYWPHFLFDISLARSPDCVLGPPYRGSLWQSVVTTLPVSVICTSDNDRAPFVAFAWVASYPWEAPRLWRGGSRSLTFAGVHPRNSRS